MKRSGHTWRWAMLDGGTVRRTAVVRLLWIEGHDGPFERLGASAPVCATLSSCNTCGMLAAEVELPDGRPPMRAYGVDLESLLVGHGVPACRPGELSRDYHAATAPSERRAAA